MSTSKTKLYTDSERNECISYFLWREENPNGTMEEAAENLGFSRATLYRRINQWQKTGVWQEIEQQIMLPKKAALDNTINNVVGSFPVVLQMILAEAVDPATKPSQRRAHAKFLAEHVVNPYFERLQEQGSEEMEYIESQPDFMPTDIPLLNAQGVNDLKRELLDFHSDD